MKTHPAPADPGPYALVAGDNGIWTVCLRCSGDHAALGLLDDHLVLHQDVLRLMAEHDAEHHFAEPPETSCTVCASEPAWDGPPTMWPIGGPAPIAGLCVGCALWTAAVKTRFAHGRHLDRDASGAPTARVAGRLYIMQPDPPPGKVTMRGFGGRRFEIRYFTGKSIVGSNLWDCGEIPARWRPLLEDNAVLISDPALL